MTFSPVQGENSSVEGLPPAGYASLESIGNGRLEGLPWEEFSL
jgi:hypothetical protein